MASQEQLLSALQKPYNRLLFATDVLSRVFTKFDLHEEAIIPNKLPNATEQRVVQSVHQYAAIALEDDTNIICYEIELQPTVRIDQNRVAIQHYVRKLVPVGEAALVNFVAPCQSHLWRLTLVARDSELTESGVEVKDTHPRRYTYLVETDRPNRTLAERLEKLAGETLLDLNALVRAFSVERMSKEFFDEYKHHYQNFVCYLTGKRMVKQKGKWVEQQMQEPSAYLKSVFNGSEKDTRDFCKKLLGRIVFLYFVQKKRWLGASTTDYTDGAEDFVYQIFNKTGGNANFFPIGLTELFFDVLNKPRLNDDYTMPGSDELVKMPYLNGGLFTRDRVDELLHKKGNMMTFPPDLFSDPDQPDTPLKRGFLDFLNAYNFTVYEDSPNDHTVAVDPEMLGHIFENLLEDNKDKGTFYTPQEIVSYMCRESLIEYLTTHLSAEYTVYQELGNEQVQLFGNEQRVGQLALVQEQGDRALKRSDVVKIVADKDVADLTQAQLCRIDELLDRVKICDPAIGSGAFPMGLLQEIFATKEMIAQALEQDWNPAQVKENIIQHSIYGVDIEQGAVDIARLRFWLSLIVDIEQPKALPNLDYKIVVGDSLLSKFEDQVIEVDWEVSKKQSSNKHVTQLREALATFVKKKQAFFQLAQNDKKALATDIRHHKLGALIEQAKISKDRYFNENPKRGGFDPTAKDRKFNLEREIKLKEFEDLVKQLQHLQQHPEREFTHFDWQLDFAEILNPTISGDNAGFDVVIGNPPYGATVDDVNILKEKYSNTRYGEAETYKYFVSKGLDLVRTDGVLSYIMSNSYLQKDNFKDLRKLIVSASSSVVNINLGDNVFEDVNLPTSIFITHKKTTENSQVGFADLSNQTSNWFITNFKIHWLDQLDDKYRFIANNEIFSRKDTIALNEIYDQVMGVKVYQIGKGKPKQTDREKKEDVFVSTEKKNDSYMKFIDQGIKKYRYIDNRKYIKYGKWLAEPRSKDFFVNPKVIVREVVNPSIYAHYYKDEAVVKNTNAVIIQKNKNYSLKYLLGLLNSKLISYYVIHTSPKSKNKSFPSFTSKQLKSVPIKKTTDSQRKRIHTLVDYILWLNTQELSDLTDKLIPAYFEQIIDGLVYELYFPDLLKKHERQISPHLGELPAFTDDMNEEEKMRICRTVFARLNDEQHPVRNHLFYLSSIPEIAIIEGYASH